MKLSDDMLFGHPVLWDQTDDYQDGVFEAEFEVNLSDDTITLSVKLDVNCEDIKELIESGAAGMGFYVICRRTYQNRLIEIAPGSTTTSLPASQFFGTVQIRPVVWAKEPRTAWTSGMLHGEYGEGVSFPAAALLAIGTEARFSVDRERLKPFETIFSLAATDQLDPGQFKVDPDENRITIYTNPDTKSSIDRIRNDVRGRTVLLNAIYLPAVMEVLSQMKGGSKDFESRAWFRVFEAKCAAASIDPESVSPIEGAQKLLNQPFNQIDKQKESLFD